MTTEPPGDPGPDPIPAPAGPAEADQDTETARVPAQDPAAPPPAILWAHPSSAATRLEVPGAPGFLFADAVSRWVAWLIDSLVVGVIGIVVAAALGFGRTSAFRTGSSFSTNTSVSGAALFVPFVLIGLVYFVFFWTGGRRATPGQRIFHLQVGNAFEGRGLTLAQATRRWVGYGTWIGLFGIVWPGASLVELIWVIVLLVTTVRSPTRQGLHDRFANSAVVRPSSESSRGLAKGCLIVLLVIVALWLVAIIALIFLGSQASNILRDVGTSV